MVTKAGDVSSGDRPDEEGCPSLVVGGRGDGPTTDPLSKSDRIQTTQQHHRMSGQDFTDTER